MERALIPMTAEELHALPGPTAFHFMQYSQNTGFQYEGRLGAILPDSHAKVDQMPLVESFDGLTMDEKQRALRILSIVSHAYIWGDGKMGVLQRLPPQLAIPLHRLGIEFGVAPLATYATTVLWNCSLVDRALGWVPNNVAVDLTFTGSSDEKLFYSVSPCIEVAGAEVLNPLISAASCILGAYMTGIDVDHWLVNTLLRGARNALSQMVSLLLEVLRMDSEIFYWRMRPYFAGWGLVKATGPGPQAGVHYDGVDHPGETRRERDTMLREVRAHMPRSHREIVEEIELSYSGVIKAYVEASPAVVNTFNEVMDQVLRFGRVHLTAAKKFAVREAGRSGKTAFGLAKDSGAGGGAIGAGGSKLEPFLRGLAENTKSAKVSLLL